MAVSWGTEIKKLEAHMASLVREGISACLLVSILSERLLRVVIRYPVCSPDRLRPPSAAFLLTSKFLVYSEKRTVLACLRVLLAYETLRKTPWSSWILLTTCGSIESLRAPSETSMHRDRSLKSRVMLGGHWLVEHTTLEVPDRVHRNEVVNTTPLLM